MAKRPRPRPAGEPSPQPAVPRWPGALSRLRGVLPWLLVLVLLALLYPGPMFEGKVFGSADSSASDAFRQVGDALRAQGEYPFWNPYLFVGMPTFGSLAYTVGIYPPTVVFEFLQDHLGFPPLTWLLGHLLLGGVGMWWLLGRWNLPWAARWLGCVAWLWFPKVVAWGVHGHGSKLGAAMALPWLVGLAWEILARGRLRAVGLAALVLGLQFLRGHVQISYYTLLLLGALTIWNLIWPLQAGERPAMAIRWRRTGLMAVVVMLGLAMGAALLLPVHDYAAISTRGQDGASGGGGDPYEFATQWSMAPEDLGAVVVPTAAGFGKATYVGRMPFNDYPNYLGLMLLGLAAAAWVGQQRRLVLALLVLLLLTALLSMGRFSPGIYQLCYEVLPYFTKFRVPSMVMVVPALLVAVLAALGATNLSRLESGPALMWLRRAAWAVLAIGGLMATAGATGLVKATYIDQLTSLAAQAGKPTVPVLTEGAWDLHRSQLIRHGLVLLVAGSAMLLAARRPAFRTSLLVPVLALLVLVDMGSVARLVTHPEHALLDVARTQGGGAQVVRAMKLERTWLASDRISLPADLAAALQTTCGPNRVLPLGSDAGNNAFMTAGVHSLGGYHAAKPASSEAARSRLFGRLPSGAVARWLGTAAVTFPGRLDDASLEALAQQGLELVLPGREAGGRMIYPLRDALPRARLVDRYQVPAVPTSGDGLEQLLDDLAAGRRDAAGPVALNQQPVPPPETGPEPLPVPEIVEDGINRVTIRARTPRPALLLLADTSAPGWRVTVDGEPAPLLVADHMLRAVALSSGDHEVRFEYRDPAFTRGLSLALAGLAVTLLLLAWPWLRRLRPETHVSGGE